MQRPLNVLRRFLSLPTHTRTPVRRQPTTRLWLECLEDRLVPTVLFTPQNGAENATNDGGKMLGQTSWGVPIYTIYWGSYWGTSAGQAYASQIQNSINSFLYYSPYLDGLHQYGVNYRAGVPGSGTVQVFNYSDPSNGFSVSDLRNVVGNAIDNQGLPESDDFSNEGIYVVLTPPGISTSGDAGYHTNDTDYDFPFDFDNMVEAWVGTNGGIDGTTNTFSHEVVEAMTDSNGDAWQVDPRNGSSWNELGDNEAQNYSYRLNGYQVQSYWSQANGAYMVSDGNSETVTVNNGQLIVNGGQMGASYNDTFTVSENYLGGVQVNLDGQVFSFDSGQISSIQLNTQSGGFSTVNVSSTPSGVALYVNGQGYDTVNAGDYSSSNVGGGSGYVGSIKGFVDVYGSGSISLNVDDSGDGSGQTAWMYDGAIYYGGAAGIYFSPTNNYTGGVTNVNVYGGVGGNTFNVENTSNLYYSTFLDTGTGNDKVNVYAANGNLYDYNPGGSDATNIGVGSVANIKGWVDAYGSGSTALTVDDHLDTTARTPTLTSSQLTGLGNAGTIYYGGGVSKLTIDGSSQASTYNIQSTSKTTPVSVVAGSGNDTFNVGSANSLNGIQGALTLNGGGGSNTLTANDASSATGQSYTLSATQLTRSGIAAITYASLSAINATASGNDKLTLLSPVPIVATTFNGGSGTNMLQGANVVNSWAISGVNSGKLDSVSFSNFQNLVGGNTTDNFKFTTTTGRESSINGGAAGGTNRLDYSSLGSAFAVTVNLATNSAPLLSSGFSNINAVAGSTDTANKLIGPNGTNQWTLAGVNAGAVNGFTFSGMPHLVGGTGVDSFKFSNTNATILSIQGGGAPVHQGDWLDYSSLSSTSTVTVNLATGSATNVNAGAVGAVTGVQNVIGTASGTNHLTGSAQGNILIGGSGANTLTGGSGNSLLIGGSGHGSITGGTGQDILIAGTTTYNAATAAGRTSLMAILAELQSADAFAQKVYDIIHGNNLGGGSDLNGSNKLTWGISGATVTASTGIFKLSGDASAASTADWFFASSSSTVSDFNDDGVKDEHNNNAIGVF